MLSGLHHAVDVGGLSRLCQSVARAPGVTISANNPVVGSSFAQVESGFVAAEILQLRESGGSFDSLYPFLPGTVGGGDIELVVGKSSGPANLRSEEHTSELESLMRTSFAVVCLKKKKKTTTNFITGANIYHRNRSDR